MSRRNVWLKFDEWELIREEFPNSFNLSDYELKEWNHVRKYYKDKLNILEEPKCFPRCEVYHLIHSSKNPKIINTLCRENWRSQDMCNVMSSPHVFIGFIINHCDNINMDTTLSQWDNIRTQMNDVIDKSDKRIWFADDLIELYRSLSDTLSYANHNG